MKKRVLSVLLATAMVAALTACGGSQPAPATQPAAEEEATEEAAEAEEPAAEETAAAENEETEAAAGEETVAAESAAE